MNVAFCLKAQQIGAAGWNFVRPKQMNSVEERSADLFLGPSPTL